MHRSSTLLLLALAALLLVPVDRAAAQTETRMRAVERGLLPAVLIEGRDTIRYSIYERMKRHHVPGVSIAVVHGGRFEWAEGYGVTRAGGSDSVHTATRFQAASISKPVAASGVLRLVDAGRLTLDEDVNTLLQTWQVPQNGFTSSEEVTLRRLLSHTAGTTVHGFPGYAAGVRIPTTAEVLDGLGNTAEVVVDTIPGSAWRYSGGGYTIAQLVVSDVSRRSFAEVMRDVVLDPLGMYESTFEQPLPDRFADDAAVAHGWDGESLAGDWHAYPEQAAAGLWTTPTDLVRFALGIARAYTGESERFLSRAIATEMLTPVLEGTYGLGFGVMGNGEELRFSHGGSNEGYRCYLVMYPETGDGLVVMTNGDGGADLSAEVHRAVSDVYGWPHAKPEVRKPVSIDPALLEKYAGEYELPWGQRYALRAGDGKLHVEGTGRYPSELFPDSDTEFFGADVPMQVRFEVDDEGRLSGLAIRRGGGEILAEKVQ